ncbi:MAG: hypothetical protein LBP35_06020 [Candidatus Ancillula trichonymphae]|nr:hypothetical protein [Candidatus Ancillula trichonymphae]
MLTPFCNTKVVDGVAVNVDGKDFANYDEIKQYTENTGTPKDFLLIGTDPGALQIFFLVDKSKVNDQTRQYLAYSSNSK